jgi:hypothetical protein
MAGARYKQGDIVELTEAGAKASGLNAGQAGLIDTKGHDDGHWMVLVGSRQWELHAADIQRVKLTPSQWDTLRECAKPGGRTTIPTYPPTIRLLQLRLIERVGSPARWGNPTFAVTDTGKAVLATLTQPAV